MKHLLATITATLLLVGGSAVADTGSSHTDGVTFGQGQLTTNYNAINNPKVFKNPTDIPDYNNQPPQTKNYTSGATLLTSGNNRISDCKTYQSSGNKIVDQDCAAVNFLAGNTRAHYNLSPSDPAIVAGEYNASTAASVAGQVSTDGQCTTKTTTTPAVTQIEQCNQFMGAEADQCVMGEVVQVSAASNYQCQVTYKSLETLTCDKMLTTACQYQGTNMTGLGATKVAPFLQPTMTINSSKVGLYDYKFQVPHGSCGTEGHAELDFNLDDVADGSYITMNLSDLDDAAVISVNGQPIFAGYPNSGPYYTSSTLGTNNTSFQMNYQWSEQVGGGCLQYGYDDSTGQSYCTQPIPASTMTFTATTKLLDYCPSGYSPVSQDPGTYTCGDGNTCYSAPSSYSPNNMQGFFCNAEGKFLMNRHEGGGTWAGTVNAQANLKVGQNQIVVYWGTAPYSKACGNLIVSGQVYNVSPKCTDTWVDNCTSLEQRSQ